MTKEEILEKITELVEESASLFGSKLDKVQKRVWDDLQLLLKKIDIDGDRIVPSVANLKIIGDISRKLLKGIVNKEYKEDVKEYIKSFNGISSLQNQYYKILENEFKPTALLQAVREEAVRSTLENLTQIIPDAEIGRVKNILRQNITGGGSYRDLMKTMSSTVIGDEQSGGLLKPQLKTYTVTSVAQYSRNYSQIAASGLNFEWYQYVGSVITTTRCFCHAMVKKRFFHVSEIPDIIKGNFKEFEDMECEISSSTDLPDGMIKGTNVSNFMTLAGGWNCQHSIYPVTKSLVPKDVRDRFKEE